MSNGLPNKILLVDSDVTNANLLSEQVGKQGIELFAATDLNSAKYRFNNQFFRCVFIEHQFAEVNGLALIQRWRHHELQEKRSAGFVLMTTGALAGHEAALIKELKRIIVVQKPIKYPGILSQIQRGYKMFQDYEVQRKTKNKILNNLESTRNLGLAIHETKGYQEVLGDDYIPMLLDLYTKAGKYDAGLALLAKAGPDSMDPLTKLNMQGKLHMLAGNTAEAIKLMEEADRIAPQNMERLTSMVDLYLKMEEPDQAVDKQKELLTITPDDPDYKFNLFKQLDESGYGRHAANFCRETTGPKEVVRYFNNKGVALARSKSPKEAISEYERALRYYPNNKDNHLIHFNIALAHVRSGDSSLLNEAMKHLTTCLELEPNYEKAQKLMEKVQGMQMQAS